LASGSRKESAKFHIFASSDGHSGGSSKDGSLVSTSDGTAASLSQILLHINLEKYRHSTVFVSQLALLSYIHLLDDSAAMRLEYTRTFATLCMYKRQQLDDLMCRSLPATPMGSTNEQSQRAAEEESSNLFFREGLTKLCPPDGAYTRLPSLLGHAADPNTNADPALRLQPP